MGYPQKLAPYQAASNALLRTRQLVMLYDAVIRYLTQSRLAIQEGRFEDRLKLIEKASNIVVGLYESIDFEKGGEISQMLDNFCTAIDLRMLNLNRSNNVEECDQIIREVKMMRDAWQGIDQKFSGAAPIAQPEPTTGETASADFSA